MKTLALTAIVVTLVEFTAPSKTQAQWVQTNGLHGRTVDALAVSGTNLFAGTQGNGIWKRPLSEMMPTAVGSAANNIPNALSLEQNSPNPFNPATTIRYNLSARRFVKLVVYDNLGRQVRVLEEGSREAGNHQVELDGSNLASGVYFYLFQVDDHVSAHHLMLLQ